MIIDIRAEKFKIEYPIAFKNLDKSNSFKKALVVFSLYSDSLFDISMRKLNEKDLELQELQSFFSLLLLRSAEDYKKKVKSAFRNIQ